MRALDRIILAYLGIVSALALWRAPDNPGAGGSSRRTP